MCIRDSDANDASPADIYDVSVSGRELTISRYDDQSLSNSYISINTDRFGTAEITPQLVFTPGNWDVDQDVAVMAINDDLVDGSEALAFPNLSGTLSSIRGPLTIQGGIHAGDDRYLNNPVTLPLETNLQLSDGFISQTESQPGVDSNGDPVTIDIPVSYTHLTLPTKA